jgi:hypothetical protein
MSHTDALIQSMRKSVAKALDRKRRLGQYAIVSRNGKLTRLEPADIKPLAAAEDPAPYNQRNQDL